MRIRAALITLLLGLTALSPLQHSEMILTSGSTGPAVDLGFLTSFDSRVTFTRASTATYFDASGTLQSANSNVPRIDYGIAGGPTARGLLVEEARTNVLRNPRAEGATPGTPGTAPTNWTVGSLAGLTVTTSAVTTVNGVSVLPISITGVAGATAAINIQYESPTHAAALNGDLWAAGSFVNVTSGSFPHTILQELDELTAAGGFLAGTQAPFTPTASLLRYTVSRTFNQATTGTTRFTTNIGFVTGDVVNVSFQIGFPQIEKGAFITSQILPAVSSPADTTRAADLATYPLGSLVSQTNGSLVVDYQTIHGAQAAVSEYVADIYATNTADRYAIRSDGAGNQNPSFVTSSASVVVAGASLGTNVAGVTGRAGMAWSPGAQNGTAYGGSIISAASVAPSLPLTALTVGATGGGTSNNGNAYIQRVRYWSRTLSFNELISATK